VRTLGETVLKVRAKNAGPFWITVDVFCGDADRYKILEPILTAELIARQYHQPVETLKRFAIPSLHVIKFSFPRPVVQGSRFDRDIHGAQWAALLAEMEVPCTR